MSPDSSTTPAPPEQIRAVPVRHPGRWIAAAVIAVLAAMFVHMLVTNPVFQWDFMVDNMFSDAVLRGARTTLIMTVLAMVIGVLLGILLAVMRLSANPIVSGAAWVYIWFFRAIPRIVLLFFVANLGALYARYEFGFPFDQQLMDLFGFEADWRLFGFDGNEIFVGFTAGLIGLALSEGAYMAEIVRAGIQSVDPGQAEAAHALGMSRGKTMRRIVLPQAMRVIIPPTGNETIAMLKDTALLIAVPVTTELNFQLRAIGSRTFQVIPMAVASILWYLALASLLMVGQYFLERRFSRGFGNRETRQQRAARRARDVGSTH
ncbi:amino acid ABC transporter membrane protein, PAAT family [Blastococcus aurantiacus]|uniref:Amino acid ABC transporter membrane protein, PAAT family n=1 Tax=Blastococcus aurantiacus TaxID=1550231 RepID=A0A1G7NLS6_9ACTN|nr:amino acid ABC transporter permease [Blastococcus aurantiacus]SDF74230.1 amino acid ABC transporter membrane protein, PAAT family [Blastococcus aurantiacus]